jgi:hypothetical protein
VIKSLGFSKGKGQSKGQNPADKEADTRRLLKFYGDYLAETLDNLGLGNIAGQVRAGDYEGALEMIDEELLSASAADPESIDLLNWLRDEISAITPEPALATLAMSIAEVKMQEHDKFARDLKKEILFYGTDGTLGWLEKAPFDRILVTAGGPEIPEPLVDQLSDPGIMLIPVGQNKRNQILVRVIKENGQIKKENTGAVKFVELVGRHGW